MYNQRPIVTMKLFNEVAIEASGDEDSAIIDLREIAQAGFFSVGYTITGSGTVELTYLVGSEKDGAFVTPAAASPIGSTLAAGSGFLSFGPILAPFIKIKATEDGGAAGAVLTLSINIQ